MRGCYLIFLDVAVSSSKSAYTHLFKKEKKEENQNLKNY